MKAIVTVLGKDQKGIIASVCALLSQEGANILDISQTVMDTYFTMVMLVELDNPDFTGLSTKLEEAGKEKSLTIRIQREDIFNAMHRI